MKKMSLLFNRFPESRIKNLIRISIYKTKKSFFNIKYSFLKNVWVVNMTGVRLFFKKNPYHVFSTNPLFLKHLPEWELDIIVDAGAFHGTVGLFLAKKYPQAKVFLLEPDPESYGILCENIRLNRMGNVIPLEKGLWNRDTTLFFKKGKELSSNVVSQEGSSTISIDAISPFTLLGNIEGKKIFVKMNIEGAELEAFPAFKAIWDKNQVAFAVATDHNIDGEFTYKSIEEVCGKAPMPFHTEHNGIYKTTYVFPVRK